MPAERVNDFLSRKLVTGKNVMMAYLYLNKGAVVPEHHHESEQISYIISGALRFKVGEEDFVLNAGETIVIPSNVPHSAYAVADMVGIDVFSPIRADWLDGSDHYLRQQK
jgi:quercetin dioxygenase-like cupin family protein